MLLKKENNFLVIITEKNLKFIASRKLKKHEFLNKEVFFLKTLSMFWKSKIVRRPLSFALPFQSKIFIPLKVLQNCKNQAISSYVTPLHAKSYLPLPPSPPIKERGIKILSIHKQIPLLRVKYYMHTHIVLSTFF